MQRHNNNRVLQSAPACAACKHQRKKCNETCPLAPYFPAHRNREFQAIHKVFGVSNVSKMLKNVRDQDERRKVVESLVWEAVCRQNDAVLGPYAEYKKVLEELKACKLAQNHSQNPTTFVGQVGLGYKPIIPCLDGWNNNSTINSINNGNGIMDIINGGVNGSNFLNYFHDHNLSVIIDSSPYSNSSTYNLQSQEKLTKLQQDKEINSSVDVPIQPQQQQQQQHPSNFHQCF